MDSDGGKCIWSQSTEEWDVYETSCNNLFYINDGTPSENSMRFCCYCGKPIEEDSYVDPVDEVT